VAYWLLKTEPDAFSIDDLERLGVAPWDGVRAYMARNNLQAMKVGERAFFYHSSCDPPGVVGICEVVREAYPDHTAFDPASRYYDARSNPDKPRWFMPDVRFVTKFPRMVKLEEIRRTPGLENMTLVQRGMRLSVQPVRDEEWRIICGLAGREPEPGDHTKPPLAENDATPSP
jgi:predicted RNA-binding protein with PUA-like domain